MMLALWKGIGRCSFLSGCGTFSIDASVSWTLTAALGKDIKDLSVSNIY